MATTDGRRRLAAVSLAAGLALAGLTGCSGSPERGSFEVTPRVALIDVPVQVRLTHLDPGQRVRISATASDADGTAWTSRADFTASGSGTVSLADRSLGGSYQGVDAMGLFELMRPTSGNAAAFLTPTAGYPVRLTATAGSTTVASTTLQRVNPRAQGVTSRTLTLARDGVFGTLYLPRPGGARRPGVLLFGGSEGGESLDFNALLLAGHGYPTLSCGPGRASTPAGSSPSVALEAARPRCCSAPTSRRWCTPSSSARPTTTSTGAIRGAAWPGPGTAGPSRRLPSRTSARPIRRMHPTASSTSARSAVR